MTRRALAMVAAIVLAHSLCLADVTLIDDEFDGTELSQDWSVCFNLTQPSSGWDYSVAAGTLAVTDVRGFGSDEWSAVRLRQACRATGDFRLDCWLGWAAGTNGAMQQLRVVLLDSTGSHLASAGFSDAWVLFSGVAYASVGGEGYQSSAYLPLLGEAWAAIARTDSTVRIYWDSDEVLVGTESAPVDSLELSFWYYSYPGAYFGTERVDRVTVTAPETPVEETTWTRVKMLYRN